MLRATVIPVLLGDCPSAHFLAMRIYLKCGIVSYICDKKRKITDLVNPFSRFFCIHSRKETRVILDSLDYLSASKDYLPIIIPCNEFFNAFTKENEAFLEARFIISDKKSFFGQKPMSVFKT